MLIYGVMSAVPEVEPLSKAHRSTFFYILLFIFLVSIPFLFLYATGYRLQLGEGGTLISTGGIYVAAERTGAEIYIDNELVRETRVFRRAFYAQSLEPGTHRVHVQKEDHHTWVKELPVYAHLVTEAQAFNLPIRPQVRIIAPWRAVSGEVVLFATSTVNASTTNQFTVATSSATSSLVASNEFANLIELFSTSTATGTVDNLLTLVSGSLLPDNTATTASSSELSPKISTTSKEIHGVKLYQDDEDVFASYVGSRSAMPYYYCAEEFELLGTSSAPLLLPESDDQSASVMESEPALLHPVQEVAEDAICNPIIKIDRQGQKVKSFDFFPGSADFIVMALEHGIYVTEVDPRSWQNTQPLLLGENLDMRVEGGNVYVYDEELIYQVLIND